MWNTKQLAYGTPGTERSNIGGLTSGQLSPYPWGAQQQQRVPSMIRLASLSGLQRAWSQEKRLWSSKTCHVVNDQPISWRVLGVVDYTHSTHDSTEAWGRLIFQSDGFWSTPRHDLTAIHNVNQPLWAIIYLSEKWEWTMPDLSVCLWDCQAYQQDHCYNNVMDSEGRHKDGFCEMMVAMGRLFWVPSQTGTSQSNVHFNEMDGRIGFLWNICTSPRTSFFCKRLQ